MDYIIPHPKICPHGFLRETEKRKEPKICKPIRAKRIPDPVGHLVFTHIPVLLCLANLIQNIRKSPKLFRKQGLDMMSRGQEDKQ